MTLKNVTQIEDFLAAVKKCEGEVWLESRYGDKFNLKSELSQYLAIGALLSSKGTELELYCSRKRDEEYFYKFFKDHPEAL